MSSESTRAKRFERRSHRSDLHLQFDCNATATRLRTLKSTNVFALIEPRSDAVQFSP